MNKFLTVAFATTLLASTAMAEDRTVTVDLPKSITVVCSDTVAPGTVVLSNPPKFSCKDYKLAKAMVGTGITIGPDSNINRITRALRRATRSSQIAEFDRRQSRRNFLTESPLNEPRVSTTHMDNSWRDIGPDRTLDDFDKKFPGINRNRKFYVSDSETCRGWVSVARILNGECKNARINVN
jgi:hypothetical protein